MSHALPFFCPEAPSMSVEALQQILSRYVEYLAILGKSGKRKNDLNVEFLGTIESVAIND